MRLTKVHYTDARCESDPGVERERTREMRERVGPLYTGCSRMSTVTAPSLSQFSTDLASNSAFPEIPKKINGPRVVNKRIEPHTAVTKKFEAWFSKRDFAEKRDLEDPLMEILENPAKS